jgi:hypothetical protein
MPEKKDSYPATTPDPKPDVTNQQVVQVLLDLLKEARQRASAQATAELPPEVARDVAFANAEFALIDRGLRMQTPFANVRINPSSGRNTVQTNVTISGANFVPPAAISFDDQAASRPATDVTVKSPTEITATAPPRTQGPGTVDVVITTFGGTVRLVSGFTYTT